MHNDKFTVYPGKFPCKTCGEEVKSLRLLKENGNATWMCSNKHLSIVPLIPVKKKKKDYEREV
jgi:hypothetical protein